MSELEVIFKPQDIIASALQPALAVTMENAVFREIIQGMDYETGEWTQNGNATHITVSFQREHDEPPVLVLVYAHAGQIPTYTIFGQMFINYLNLLGYATQTSTSQAKFGQKMLWSTGSSNSSIGQNTTNITSKEGLADYATKDSFYFGNSSGSSYIRNNRKYSWIAIWK